MPNSAELHAAEDGGRAARRGHATAIYAERAKNAEIWDVEDGKRYIDFGAGIAVVNTGHRIRRSSRRSRSR